MNAIETEKLGKNYPGFSLSDISLRVPEGTIWGIIGENGAGKTTLIKLLLGMIKKDAGEAKLLGCPDVRRNPEIREEIGVVLDEVNLPPVMTSEKVGRMMSMIYKSWDRDLYAGLLKKLRIPEKKKFSEFSRGNKMKLGIACALSHHPKLLILDEATSGLDPVVRDELLDILMDFTRDEHHSILISSHIVSDLEKACDYIAFLHEGSLLLAEEKDTLMEEYVKLSCSSESFEKLDRNFVIGKRETPYGTECIIRKDKVLPEMNVQAINIEELFIMMVKGERYEGINL